MEPVSVPGVRIHTFYYSAGLKSTHLKYSLMFTLFLLFDSCDTECIKVDLTEPQYCIKNFVT